MAQADRDWLNAAMSGGLITRQLAGEGSELHLSMVPAKQEWTQVMAEVAADFAGTVIEGETVRIRFCENSDCRWVFYDDTRNRTKRYCDDKMCGNLMKVRRFRAKKKAEAIKDNG